MRVIAGRLKGRRLKPPRSNKIRPTEARLKENIFNILGPYFFDMRVLDLFAGTGAIGLEYLSRGAGSCVFVDSSREAQALVRENLEGTGLEDRARLLAQDFKEALRSLGQEGEVFDEVYIDPPYKKTRLYQEALDLILEGGLLAESGRVILEVQEGYEPHIPGPWELIKEAQYRQTKFVVLSKIAGGYEGNICG